MTFLGLAKDDAHAAATTTPKSLVLRSRAFHFLVAVFFCLPVDPTETRKTYRAVFSEPRVVIPATSPAEPAVPGDVVECDHPSGQLLEGVLRPSHAVEADERQKKRPGDSIDVGRVRKKKKNKK